MVNHSFIRRLLKGGSRAANAITKPSGLKVLIYHSITPNVEATIDVSLENFDAQIQLLLDEGYQIISLAEAVSNKNTNQNKSVVLTFDDGFTDFYENAIPILQKHGNIPATVYSITQFVLDPSLPFKFNSGVNKKSMNVSQVEEIAKLNFINIGSHTHTHVDLVKGQNIDFKQELEEARGVIRQLTGKQDIDFCYPWANHNSQVKKKVSEIYSSATIGKGGINKVGFDTFEIARIPVKNESITDFKQRLDLQTLLEDRLRDIYNRIA